MKITQYFSVLQILREIKFGKETKSAKSAILTHWEALNFDCYEFVQRIFWRLKFTKLTKFRAPKMAKNGIFELQRSISRRIWVTEMAEISIMLWFLESQQIKGPIY